MKHFNDREWFFLITDLLISRDNLIA